MATVMDWQNALPPGEPGPAKLSADSSTDTLAACPQDQGQTMQEPRQMATNLALAQGWSFTRVSADSASPESASSGTIQPLPQQDPGAAVLERPQEPAPELSIADTMGSEASKTEAPAQTSAPTGLSNSLTRQAPPLTGYRNRGGDTAI
ncbi:hypothetical protein C8A00DRAFT_12353 [Chaetomidium leptoderma]|uniref:Uncharacterized protein n=1 Tax=Chaetomidium leptoderma TaxID=669021 RepID=A0AAN7A1D8_9PEZI|nr:hypothetical protein C8A00DRAFT_12353 [Chaetomidium leptoderma]